MAPPARPDGSQSLAPSSHLHVQTQVSIISLPPTRTLRYSLELRSISPFRMGRAKLIITPVLPPSPGAGQNHAPSSHPHAQAQLTIAPHCSVSHGPCEMYHHAPSSHCTLRSWSASRPFLPFKHAGASQHHAPSPTSTLSLLQSQAQFSLVLHSSVSHETCETYHHSPYSHPHAQAQVNITPLPPTRRSRRKSASLSFLPPAGPCESQHPATSFH